jgi:BirA family transcriptional regulator, biotin operon repressor / biotin---[acetyl-CoA-carboxylase] ligase
MAKIYHIRETQSTNEHLSKLLKTDKPEEGCIVWTDFQTAGKGQTGNSWESEFGKNLTFSIILYPDFLEITNQFLLSQLISVAITDVLSEYIPEELSIKWPNDIYVGKKKIAGILIENSISGRNIDSCIAGIGININQGIFQSNAPNPVSLKLLTGVNYNLKEILQKIQHQIFFRYIQVCNHDEAVVTQEYKNRLFRKNDFHNYKSGDSFFKAKIKSIKQTGHLVLETEDGTEKEFAFKEVEFMLN